MPSPQHSSLPRESPHAAIRGVALTLPVCVVWGPGLAGYGGLAPAAIVVLTAIFVAAVVRPPHDLLEDKTDGLSSTLRHTLGEIIGAGVIGACFAPLIHDFGDLTAMAIAGVVWVMAVSINRIGGSSLLFLLGSFGVISAAFLSYVLVNGVAWTLLEPQWSTWRHWLGASVMGGFVIGGASVGLRDLWGDAASPVDEANHWIGVGASVLAFTCGALLIGYEWEHSAPEPTFNLLPILGWLAVLTAASAFQMSPRESWLPWIGILFGAWFAGPGFPAVTYWWITILPVLTFAYLLLTGVRGWRALFTGALVTVITVGFWPGLPAHASDAGVLGLTLVFIFWLLASRCTLKRQL